MSKKPENLTKAQARALSLARAGTVFAYNGVSFATAKVLVSRGLCEWVTEPVVSHEHTRHGRWIHTRDWAIRASS